MKLSKRFPLASTAAAPRASVHFPRAHTGTQTDICCWLVSPRGVGSHKKEKKRKEKTNNDDENDNKKGGAK